MDAKLDTIIATLADLSKRLERAESLLKDLHIAHSATAQKKATTNKAKIVFDYEFIEVSGVIRTEGADKSVKYTHSTCKKQRYSRLY